MYVKLTLDVEKAFLVTQALSCDAKYQINVTGYIEKYPRKKLVCSYLDLTKLSSLDKVNGTLANTTLCTMPDVDVKES